jgi:hypothetical protein
MRLFGLMYVDSVSSTLNLRTTSSEDLVRTYCENASTLHDSLKFNGRIGDFTLLTNDSETVLKYLGHHHDLRVLELEFTRDVPPGSRFYGAHYKLDVLRYFGGLEAELVGLCDLDMYCLRPIPQQALTLLSQGQPLAYDITNQVSIAYGSTRIGSDLTVVSGRPGLSRWFGGEFLCGSPEFFSDLSDVVDGLYPRYVDVINELHHVGDEMVTSAALGSMIADGLEVGDAGALGLVARHWNARTKHRQPPLRVAATTSLLHLPADKQFLATLAGTALEPKAFLRRYHRHRAVSIVQRFANLCVRLVHRTSRPS